MVFKGSFFKPGEGGPYMIVADEPLISPRRGAWLINLRISAGSWACAFRSVAQNFSLSSSCRFDHGSTVAVKTSSAKR